MMMMMILLRKLDKGVGAAVDATSISSFASRGGDRAQLNRIRQLINNKDLQIYHFIQRMLESILHWYIG